MFGIPFPLGKIVSFLGQLCTSPVPVYCLKRSFTFVRLSRIGVRKSLYCLIQPSWTFVSSALRHVWPITVRCGPRTSFAR